MVSSHWRPTLVDLGADPRVDALMIRYNAAHPGAETEVFPSLTANGIRRVGIASYTATRWGYLLDEKKMPPGEKTPRASDCYRFVLSNPHVDVCSIGPSNGAELDEALETTERGPMSPDEIAWMKRVGAFVRDQSKSAPRGVASRIADRVFAM